MKQLFLNNHDDIIKESNIKNLIAISKETNFIYNIESINAWRYPFLTLKHKNTTYLITIKYLFQKYNIYEV